MYNNLSVVMLQISSPLACGGPVAKLSVLDRVAKMRAVRDSFLNARMCSHSSAGLPRCAGIA